MTKRKVKKVKAHLRGWIYGAFDQLILTNASVTDIRLALCNWNKMVEQSLHPSNWKWVNKTIRQLTGQLQENASLGFYNKLEEAVSSWDTEEKDNDNKATKGG